MTLSEPRLALQQSPVHLFGLSGVRCFVATGREKLAGECLALGPRRVTGQERAVWLEPGIVAGRNHQDDLRPDPLQIRNDRPQAGPKLLESFGVLFWRVDRNVNQLPRDVPRRRR